MSMTTLALADEERLERTSKFERSYPLWRSTLAADRNNLTSGSKESSSNECKYGVIVPVALRKDKEGKLVQYWRDVLQKIPDEITHVYVPTRLQENDRPKHSRITRVLAYDVEHPEFDPNFLGRGVLMNHGDSTGNVKWRSSLTLDFALSLRYVGTHCTYVLWIEDDAILPTGWFDLVKTIQYKHEEWTFDLLASSGAVGLLINSRISQSLSQFLIRHFDHSPVDWLYDYWERSYFKPTHPTWELSRRFNILGHRGTVSSFPDAAERPLILPNATINTLR